MFLPVQSIVIPKNLVLSLDGIIWSLSMISIGSLFLFLNIMLAVLLVEKISLFSAAHVSNLLVTPCSTLDATLLISYCIVYCYVICIEWSVHSIAKFSQYTIDYHQAEGYTEYSSLWNSQICLFILWCRYTTLTFFHLSLISSAMNSIIRPCIPMFLSFLNILFLLILS